MQRAVFLDRDGTLNEDRGYVGHVADFQFLPGVFAALRRLHEAGYLLVLCTNQSGLARGRFTLDDYEELTAHMQEELRAHGAALDAIYYCPHHPQAQVEKWRCQCDCRKPAPGMFRQAIDDLDLDVSACAAAGDRARDLIGPAQLGVRRLFLINPPPGEIDLAPEGTVIAADLGQMVPHLVN